MMIYTAFVLLLFTLIQNAGNYCGTGRSSSERQ